MKRRDRMYDIRFMQSLFPAAEAEAASMGEEEPGAEHLVLAALDFQEGSARRVFERVGGDPDRFRAALVEHREEALRSVGVDGAWADGGEPLLPPPGRPSTVYRSAPSAREVFPKVVTLVKRDKSRLSGAYVLLAVSQSEHGNTAGALARMGIDRDEIARAAQSEIDERSA
jgi:ATP-dependent Clp protease ATP-binding subunit ClpA